MKKTIQQGAEAIITLENNQIQKHRIKKSYRHPDLDQKLRKRLTKSETKIISKLQNIIPVPKIIKSDDKENITMEYIKGQKLSEHLEELDYKTICKQIAENISKLHDQDIIHGDLTTSNMIYVKNNNTPKPTKIIPTPSSNLSDTKKLAKQAANKFARQNLQNNEQACELEATYGTKKGQVYLIDFGLAFHSPKIEDKAVDLHLLKQALEAKHFTIAENTIKIILDNYHADKHKEILKRINIIEKRGRYKN